MKSVRVFVWTVCVDIVCILWGVLLRSASSDANKLLDFFSFFLHFFLTFLILHDLSTMPQVVPCVMLEVIEGVVVRILWDVCGGVCVD